MFREKPVFVVLTCEHGGNEVPEQYASLFTDAGGVLPTHRGFDPGALGVAIVMASALSAPIVFSLTTRLLVDLNRSVESPSCFSEFSSKLSDVRKREVIAAHYTPHRSSVERVVLHAIDSGSRVLHIGVHSFTDVFNGSIREIDCALLFDPDREFESAVCTPWIETLKLLRADLRHRVNEPYKGTDDGLTTTLRAKFADSEYAGVEIEIRQGLVCEPHEQRRMGLLFAHSVRCAVEGL